MGLRATNIRNADWHDRLSLLLLLAIAHALLTLIGAASERSGMDVWLKTTTVERRQGSHWYGSLLIKRDEWLRKLTAALAEVLNEHHVLKTMLGSI